MKISLLSVIMLSAMSVSAQTMDLPMCLKNLGTTQNKLSEVFREKGELSRETVRLLSQNTDLREKLSSCEKRPNTPQMSSPELERLRTQNGELSRENLRLLTQNTDFRAQLSSCERRPQNPSAELERLTKANNEFSRENFRLSSANTDLTSQVRQLTASNNALSLRVIELQRALNSIQSDGPRSFISMAGCADYFGSIDNRYINIATGKSALEAETNAKVENQKKYGCAFGSKVSSTEEIKTQNRQANYCAVGCLNFAGEIDGSYVSGSNGRNKTEAKFNAYRSLNSAFTCPVGSTVLKCE